MGQRGALDVGADAEGGGVGACGGEAACAVLAVCWAGGGLGGGGVVFTHVCGLPLRDLRFHFGVEVLASAMAWCTGLAGEGEWVADLRGDRVGVGFLVARGGLRV